MPQERFWTADPREPDGRCTCHTVRRPIYRPRIAVTHACETRPPCLPCCRHRASMSPRSKPPWARRERRAQRQALCRRRRREILPPGRAYRGALYTPYASHLRDRAALWRRGDGAPGGLAVVVRAGRWVVDELLAPRGSDAAYESPRGRLAAARRGPRLPHWFRHGGARPSAALHGEHHHRD